MKLYRCNKCNGHSLPSEWLDGGLCPCCNNNMITTEKIIKPVFSIKFTYFDAVEWAVMKKVIVAESHKELKSLFYKETKQIHSTMEPNATTKELQQLLWEDIVEERKTRVMPIINRFNCNKRFSDN